MLGSSHSCTQPAKQTAVDSSDGHRQAQPGMWQSMRGVPGLFGIWAQAAQQEEREPPVQQLVHGSVGGNSSSRRRLTWRAGL